MATGTKKRGEGNHYKTNRSSLYLQIEYNMFKRNLFILQTILLTDSKIKR